MDSLVKSYQDFLRYPTNVLETDSGAHILQAYHTRLQHQKGRLFVDESQASVSYLDLTHGIKGMYPSLPALIDASVLRTLETPSRKFGTALTTLSANLEKLLRSSKRSLIAGLCKSTERVYDFGAYILQDFYTPNMTGLH